MRDNIKRLPKPGRTELNLTEQNRELNREPRPPVCHRHRHRQFWGLRSAVRHRG